MTQNYKVGDKVRILDASKIISGASRGLKDGGIYEVVELYKGREYDPIVKLDDGHKFGFMDDDYNYIEKVAEDVTKFKVGDKVRINALSRFGQDFIGQEGVVHRDKPDVDGDISVQVGHRRLCYLPKDLTLVSDKPTKNQRIKTLESEVAELKAKVEALEKAQKPKSAISSEGTLFYDGKPIAKVNGISIETKSPNEQRKAIIEEAKAFVEDTSTFINTRYSWVNSPSRKHHDAGTLEAKFEVNAENRTVVALLYFEFAGGLAFKAIAKCAPDDVFNADIGKAIALGRALDLDVSKFEQAAKPTEVVVGMKVEMEGTRHPYVSTIVQTHTFGDENTNSLDFVKRNPQYIHAILDDTEAQY